MALTCWKWTTDGQGLPVLIGGVNTDISSLRVTVAQEVEQVVHLVVRSSCPHVEVSLDEKLNPKFVSMGRPAPCMAAPSPSLCEANCKALCPLKYKSTMETMALESNEEGGEYVALKGAECCISLQNKQQQQCLS